MSWWLEPSYSAVEVLGAILLSALPMSQFSHIMLGIIESKTGIDTSTSKD